MKSILPALTIAITFSFLQSCKSQETVGYTIAPYTASIIQNKESEEFQRLSGFDPGSSKGSIAIFDSPQRATEMMEHFIKFDIYDNVDASSVSDLLPDFSGETIIAQIDNHYQDIISQSDSTEMKEYAIRSMLNALDTTINAKAFILTSPELSAFAYEEINQLMKSTGADIPVFSPILLAKNKISRQFGDKSRVLILSQKDSAVAPAYSSLFYEPVVEHIDKEIDISRAISEYFMKDGQGLLSAIIVDDFNLDSEKIQSSIDKMLTVEIYTGITIGKVLEKNFEIIDCRDIAAEACFKEFRKRNIFTHTVAYPIGLSSDVQD